MEWEWFDKGISEYDGKPWSASTTYGRSLSEMYRYFRRYQIIEAVQIIEEGAKVALAWQNDAWYADPEAWSGKR